MWCPHCRQNAPIVYRGVFAYCSACDKPRQPFSAKSLNIAGKPSKIGGTVGKVMGYGVLLAGLLTAATLMLLFHFLNPTSAMGYAVGVPLAIASLVLGFALLYGSRRLHRAGTDAEREARQQALYALAANWGGMLTAQGAARALNLSVAEVDAVLGDWVKSGSDHISLEVDEEGELFYLFSRPGHRLDTFGKRYRVESEGRVRVIDALETEEAAGEARQGRVRSRS
ncbi:MAG TPA: hypothetical protein VGP93_14630 [Polyangiaceae bacterium]|nr:hypothetical protein [Polyangiaceae bacterium]